MKKTANQLIIDGSQLPLPAGYQEKQRTLCIGLDMAWFGGSKNDPGSRYDFLALALIDSDLSVIRLECERVWLIDHDLNAEETATKLNDLIKKFGAEQGRIVLAVDAPLQAVSRDLPVRTPKLKKGEVQRRACEEHLSSKRKSIDNTFGGANGWHPNIQPGAPIAPRVAALLGKVGSSFEPWTQNRSEHKNLVIECFPAEAIWGAKRMGWFPEDIDAAQAKSYKKQKGQELSAQKVKELVEAALLPFAKVCKDKVWKNDVVEIVLEKMLADPAWKRNEFYPGGKMLDDVVDSIICLATAISYTAGNAHVWHDPDRPDDGHIIGPGTLQELHKAKTRLA